MLFKGLSRKHRVRGYIFLGVVFGLIIGLALVLYKSHQDRLHYEKSLHRLSDEMETVLLSQRELEKQLSESREQALTYHQRTDALLQKLREERQRLESEIKESKRVSQQRGHNITEIEAQLVAARRRIRSLEGAAGAGERLIESYVGGVAFIEVTYTFEDSKGRRVRFADPRATGAPSADSTAVPRVSVDGKGPIASLHSTGTGFLVKPGKLITNRHVTEPWWAKEGIKNFAHFGFRPVRMSFRAFFPGVKELFALENHRSSERADLVVLRFHPGEVKLPVLALDDKGTDAVVGRPVILLGYPSGLQGLVARVDRATLRTIAGSEDTVERTKVTEELSRKGLIQPLVTWGHLSAVLTHQLTYDALTTSGGSGGPVISVKGKVVAVNYAVDKSFAGASFGVPIRFALELID